MPSEVSQMVFSLPINTISTPFAVGKYFVIVQVPDGPRYDLIPYEDTVTSIQKYMNIYKQQQGLNTWLSAYIMREPLNMKDNQFYEIFHNALDDLQRYSDQTSTDNSN